MANILMDTSNLDHYTLTYLAPADVAALRDVCNLILEETGRCDDPVPLDSQSS